MSDIDDAFTLGQDDAERSQHNVPQQRCYSGREVAGRLELSVESPDELVQLREAYSAGWASYL